MAVPSRIRTALREATHEQHEALDRSLALDSDDLTRERYVTFLQRSLSALDELEEPVMRWIDASGPRRRDCLRQDLAALEAEPAAPRTPSLIPATRSEGIGCAYVLEGSTLGGLVLAKVVEERLALTATAYLRLRGSETGSAWKAFLAQLDSFDATATEDERTAACVAARATFDHYRASFEVAQ